MTTYHIERNKKAVRYGSKHHTACWSIELSASGYIEI